MKKLLYYSTAIIPSTYANSVNVMKMCSALKSIAIDVSLTGLQGEIDDDPYIYYGAKNKFEILKVRNNKLRFFSRLWVLFRQGRKSDAIFTRYTLAAYIAAFVLKKNVIYEYHAPAYKPIYSLMEKKLASSDKVLHVFITHALEKYYLEKEPMLGSVNRIISPDGADIVIKELPVLEKSSITCGYVGSFISGKGIDTVIKVANRLPKITFHVVGGSNNEINGLKKLNTSNNIIWYGRLSQVEAMKVLEKNIDIALLPNHKNIVVDGKFDIGEWTSPIKLFEYMSYGKAIVASNIPVLCEVIRDKKNAVLADSENVDSWVNVISDLISKPEEMEQIRKNAFYDFSELYSWGKRAEILMRKYKECFED